MAGPRIEFMGRRPRFAADGSPLALTEYCFEVDDSRVVVEVYWNAIQTLDGDYLHPEEIKLAAQTWVEIQSSWGRDLFAEPLLPLDHEAIVEVAARLGWVNRFESTR